MTPWPAGSRGGADAVAIAPAPAAPGPDHRARNIALVFADFVAAAVVIASLVERAPKSYRPDSSVAAVVTARDAAGTDRFRAWAATSARQWVWCSACWWPRCRRAGQPLWSWAGHSLSEIGPSPGFHRTHHGGERSLRRRCALQDGVCRGGCPGLRQAYARRSSARRRRPMTERDRPRRPLRDDRPDLGLSIDSMSVVSAGARRRSTGDYAPVYDTMIGSPPYAPHPVVADHGAHHTFETPDALDFERTSRHRGHCSSRHRPQHCGYGGSGRGWPPRPTSSSWSAGLACRP